MFRRSNLWPHKPTLTETNLPDQTGKVFIITGGNSGVGRELAAILYQHNARIYIATRSKPRTLEVMAEIEDAHPHSKGSLVFLELVLDDLNTIKAAAETFLRRESRLDVIWNNAGVMLPPSGSKTKQGYELQMGVNTLAHFLLIKLLTPILLRTAQDPATKKNSVRVVWVSSLSVDFSTKPFLDFDNMNYQVKDESQAVKYDRSKCGNLLHAIEFDKRYPESGICSVSMTPGLLKTNLQRNFTASQNLIVRLMGKPAIMGAYTELFAGLDPSITPNDKWVCPFGAREEPRVEMMDPGLTSAFWDWSEKQVKPYL
ncbi:hypothetical protein NLU13_3814 [Sarocladium strictum]|uniref:Short-chain dehydrogenase n=1 Tax=Sarocladium strictum TaxID=5046 RepID=A0AA39GJ41_SARSR|nr:hypothetical protein NLU13_3814 [Sarocladium strictum]